VNSNIVTCALLIGGSIGCGTSDPPPDDDRVDVLTIKAVQNPDLDILFVIDDSPTMADKQHAFTAAFPALLAQLSSLPGGAPNLHIGVATSDMGTSGSAVTTPGPAIGQVGNGGCSFFGKRGELQLGGAPISPISRPFIEVARNGTTNVTGTIADAFTQMASVGAGGCGFEQTLAAMRAAFEHPGNSGFLRDTANLAVVLLTDEDDCSLLDPQLLGPPSATLGPLSSFRCFRFGVECTEDVAVDGAKTGCHPRQASEYVEDTAAFRDFLLATKGGDARRVMLGAIAGDTTPVAVEPRVPGGTTIPTEALAHSCTYTTSAGTAVADPPVRIEALIDSFPGRTNLASVCNEDLAPVATSIGKTIKRLVGDPCLERTIAIPADCVVVDITGASSVTVPECGPASTVGTPR
jgi:hypothetical protein